MTTFNAEKIELLQAEIQMKEHEVRKLQKQISDKVYQQDHIEGDPDDFTEQFDNLLDECGQVEAWGYSFYPSRILKELDPIAYQCGLNDFADSEFNPEDSDEFQALQEEIGELEDEIEYLESDISDLQEQIEFLEL